MDITHDNMLLYVFQSFFNAIIVCMCDVYNAFMNTILCKLKITYLSDKRT